MHNWAGRPLVVVKGAGDLASGVAWRLHKCGLPVMMTEIANPLVVRRTVAFARAVYAGSCTVQGVTAVLARDTAEALAVLSRGQIPVLVDPEARIIAEAKPEIVVDAIMAKRNINTFINDAPLVLALGPGFTAGRDCHAVIETKRGHDLGRVLRQGGAAPNTGVPGAIEGYSEERLLRAPAGGKVEPLCEIGDMVKKGDAVALVGGIPVYARVNGVCRGMIQAGVVVEEGTKIGDIDPRGIKEYCFTISEKALSIGGGVLEAVFGYLLGDGGYEIIRGPESEPET